MPSHGSGRDGAVVVNARSNADAFGSPGSSKPIETLRARGGRVLLVASIGGKVAIPHLSSYSMSKFAVVGLGQALRAELAQDGVSVTTVCPGLMRTGRKFGSSGPVEPNCVRS